MKTFVNNSRDDSRVPFLRGILTRSLMKAGLPFEDAFGLAMNFREELSATEEISSVEIRRRVAAILDAHGNEAVQEQYQQLLAAPTRIQVTNLSDSISAFSRGKHARYLQSSGMVDEEAEETTTLIYDQLLAHGVTSVTTSQLGYLTYLCLKQEVAEKAADRYLVWSEFQRSARPLLLLICGAVGSGKSTVATEIAHLLDIVRIQSTDMLREVMRKMVPKRLLPVLHSSSFNAWKRLTIQDVAGRKPEDLVAEGYRSQAELLALPCEAVMQRAVAESVPLILEGVHAHPDLLSRGPKNSQAIKVHVTLAVLKPKQLKERLRGRGVEIPHRHAKRYLNKFDSIWSLQTFLLSEADRCDVPIITNDDKRETIHEIILHVNYELSKVYCGSAQDVFGSVVGHLKDSAETKPWHEIVVLLGSQPEA